MSAAIPAVAKLTGRIIRILGCNPGPMTLQGTNTYLIGTGKNRVLVDTGDKDVSDYQYNLSEVVNAEELNIEHIILTHWHHDHIGGVENLYGTIAKNPKIWKHKKSEEDSPDNELPDSIPVNWLVDGQEIAVDGATLLIHHTPGHTSDHVTVTVKEENIMLSGDCILGEGTAVFEDLHSYMNSLNKILKLKPDLIYPGHGEIVQSPITKIQYYINHRNQREKQIITALQSNPHEALTAMELVQIIYTGTPKELLAAAAYNVNHHLCKLEKDKKVKCIKENDQVKWQFIEPMVECNL